MSVDAAALDAAGALIVVLDRTGRVVRINRACLATLGRAASDVLGLLMWDALLSGQEAESFHQQFLSSTVEDYPIEREHLWLGQHGNRHRISWRYTPVLDESGAITHVVGSGIDVTEQRQAEAVLRQRAETDSLTGLPNRDAFESALAAHLDPSSGVGCGLLFCDLDGFKAINDTHGHHVGDELLVRVAERLRSAVRAGDVVARLGGDEFVILLPAVGVIEVRALAARLERVVRSAYQTEAGRLVIGISIGTRIADAGDEATTVLREADAAMYAVKARRAARRGEALAVSG